MITKKHRVLLTILLIVLLSFFGLSALSACSDNSYNKTKLRVGLRTYSPEFVVVPPRLIEKQLGTTNQEIQFDAYSTTEYSSTVLCGVIPSGTAYFSIQGYDSKTYLAVPFGSNYFLYSHAPKERLRFPQGSDNPELTARFVGTPEQAYLEAFILMSAWTTDFIVLNIVDLQLDNPDDLISLIGQHCDERGATLILTSYDTVKALGYLEMDDKDFWWYFEDGFFIYFEDSLFTYANEYFDFEILGDSATIIVGVPFDFINGEALFDGVVVEELAIIRVAIMAAPLAGRSVDVYVIQLDGAWKAVSASTNWIS